MKRFIVLGIVGMSLGATQPAAGLDPFRQPPDPALPWTPEPAAVAPPPGIYLVTDTYAGDSVTRVGAVTTYSTETVHETTGSYARVLQSVGTGGSSAYDGAAFNGRASLTDGRRVAGTYYENYVLTEGGFVPVSVVFFQDDAEIARASQEGPLQPVARREPAAATETLPPLAARVAVGPPPAGGTAPFIDRPDPSPTAPERAPERVSAGSPDRSIEVLRGRRTTLSFADAGARAWRFVSGEVVVLGAVAGAAGDPFVGRWDRLAPPNTSWVVRFLIDYADGARRELAVRVVVRAPGLVE